MARRQIPQNVTRSEVLKVLLGTSDLNRRLWRGAELLVPTVQMPPNGPAPWTRVVGPVTMLDRGAAQERAVRSAGPAGDGDMAILDAGTFDVQVMSDPFAAVSPPPGFATVDFPTQGRSFPRLADALLNYCQLYDLRLAFMLIDAGLPRRSREKGRAAGVLTRLEKCAADPEVFRIGELHRHLRIDSPEARVVAAAAAARSSAVAPQADRPVLEPALLGFGTLEGHPLLTRTGTDKPLGRAAFANACRAAGLANGLHVAYVAALEKPRRNLKVAPSVLSDAKRAAAYWGRALRGD